MSIDGLASGTSAWVSVVAVASVFSSALVAAVARRRQRYWWLSMALIATSFGAAALASCLAIMDVLRVFDEVAKVGGGIAAVSLGIWHATQAPLVAAWIALITSVAAALFVLPIADPRRDSAAHRPAPFAIVTTLALAAGAVPVLLFSRSIGFVVRTIIPGASNVAPGSVARTIETHLLNTALISAVCFLFAAALAVTLVRMARRSSASRQLSFVTVVALVVSVALSAALVADLHASSVHYRDLALHGRAVR